MNKMKYDKVTLIGHVTNEGKLGIYDNALFAAFKNNNKGEKIILTVQAIDQKKKFDVYFKAVVIPAFIEGFRKQGTIFHSESMEEYLNINFGYQKPFNELSHNEKFDFIDILKNIAAEYWGINLDDPITL